eukprot:gene7360-27304_t
MWDAEPSVDAAALHAAALREQADQCRDVAERRLRAARPRKAA